jgi:hypothetical protein
MPGRHSLWVGDPAVLPVGQFNCRNPFIWVVPGDDPLGKPGQAVASKTNYIWARAFNTDQERDANGALVDFYFQSFSVALSRITLKPIGTSRVDLMHASNDDVLCVTPFVPAAPGHGCLVCVIRHMLDPLPDNWDLSLRYVQWHSQVGQCNIEVISSAPGSVRITPIQVGAFDPAQTQLNISVRRAELREQEARQLLWSNGVDQIPESPNLARVGLSESSTPAGSWWEINTLNLNVRPLEKKFVFLISEILPGAPAYELVDVISRSSGTQIGGAAALFIRG